MPASPSPGLRKAKRRPPWPAAQPAESTDAMARAEGPALPGPLPGLLVPKWRTQEAWLGELAILSLQARACLSVPPWLLGVVVWIFAEVEWGILVPDFSFSF